MRSRAWMFLLVLFIFVASFFWFLTTGRTQELGMTKTLQVGLGMLVFSALAMVFSHLETSIASPIGRRVLWSIYGVLLTMATYGFAWVWLCQM